ncbi:serine hydrolase domain-containing protein [Bradyrhizobium elkanii]|uniref:serine hydrolase domain-containing protein n=2 Tax=Bradyrhizobium elkanii TaxID=29448 RepID=UPI0035199A5F
MQSTKRIWRASHHANERPHGRLRDNQITRIEERMGVFDVLKRVGGSQIEGRYDRSFEPVMQAFCANFAERGELGASVCVTHEGRKVVDLWGGQASSNGARWTRDTISLVFSATKGATALCAHLLAERGLLDLNAPVARYWPEYAQAGKRETTVAMVLNHTAGLPHLREPVRRGGFYDAAYMTDLVARAEPFWPPGSQLGYHAFTFGWIIGEIVWRITGRSLGRFFREELAIPNGLDFWIGLPIDLEDHVAELHQSQPDETASVSRFMLAALQQPDSPAHLFLANTGGFDFASREARAAEIPAVNGVTNARGLAGLYALVANRRLLARPAIARLRKVAVTTREDATLLMPTRFSFGFMKSIDNRSLPGADQSCVLSGAAFGHAGAGGSLGFADPRARLSFGYTMNLLGRGILLNSRGQSLVDATYRALGYRSNLEGVWKI